MTIMKQGTARTPEREALYERSGGFIKHPRGSGCTGWSPPGRRRDTRISGATWRVLG